jgi:hypothetical protein
LTVSYVGKIFQFLTGQTCLNQEEIHVILGSLEAFRVGVDGTTLAEIRKKK